MPFTAPLPLRIIGKLFLKSKFLNKTLPAGFDIPKSAEAEARFQPNESVVVDEELEGLRRAIDRCKLESERATHPLFGQLTRDQWDKFNLRHAELHMSFVKPAGE